MKQRSQEWLDARAGKLTASRFAAALGLDPYCSRQKLWRQLTGRQGADPTNFAMQGGIDNEPVVIDRYEIETGSIVVPTGFHLHQKYDWMGCSPDGLVGDDGLIEVKWRADGSLYEECPEKYLPQVMGQMAIMGRHWCDFTSGNPEENRSIRIQFDLVVWREMEAGLTQFWNDYVLADKEPPRKSRKGK